MRFEITIDGPQNAISKLIKKLQNLLPIDNNSDGFAPGKSGKEGILLHKDEEDLDNTLITVSRAVHEVERTTGLATEIELRVRNLAYSEPSTGTPLFSKPFDPIPSLTIQPWAHDLPAGTNSRTIIIDAGHAFGTGMHPSSRLCLEHLESLAKGRIPGRKLKGMKVLDFGCGTGLLAIAAVKLGAEEANGVEIDRQSALTALENVERNGMTDQIDIKPGSWEKIRSKYDLILANLVPAVILRTGSKIPVFLKKGGLGIFAGFSLQQSDEIEQFFMNSGLVAAEKGSLEGWGSLIMENQRM
ncbi:50S ribosomal protein L11 methyltransferase [Thermodesulfobacteriota bacterium]